MDGGVYLRNNNHFGNGTEFNDLRVGIEGHLPALGHESGNRLCRQQGFYQRCFRYLHFR